MQYQIPKAEVDAVVQCKAGAIEKVRARVDGLQSSEVQGPSWGV